MARKRKTNTRQVKPKIYIFCEGEKTEPSYIRAYIATRHPHCTRLKKAEQPVEIKDTIKNTPKQLVEVAVDWKKKLDFAGDQVWVLYDRESERRYSNEDHQTALSKANSHDIKVALSNVCFEFWLLLHLTDRAPAMESCEELIGSKVFKAAFASIGIEKYNKKDSNEVSKKLVQETYVAAARVNAQRINQQTIKTYATDTDKPYKLKPYTDVYKLLDAIDEIASQ